MAGNRQLSGMTDVTPFGSGIREPTEVGGGKPHPRAGSRYRSQRLALAIPRQDRLVQVAPFHVQVSLNRLGSSEAPRGGLTIGALCHGGHRPMKPPGPLPGTWRSGRVVAQPPALLDGSHRPPPSSSARPHRTQGNRWFANTWVAIPQSQGQTFRCCRSQ